MPKVWQINLFVKYGGDGETEREKDNNWNWRCELNGCLCGWTKWTSVSAFQMTCTDIKSSLKHGKCHFQRFPCHFFSGSLSLSCCVYLLLFWILFCNIFSSINPCFKAPVRGYTHTLTLTAMFFTLFVPEKSQKSQTTFLSWAFQFVWFCEFVAFFSTADFSSIFVWTLQFGFVSVLLFSANLCTVIHLNTFRGKMSTSIAFERVSTHACHLLCSLISISVASSACSLLFDVFSIKVSNLRCDLFSNGIINLNGTKNRKINKMSKRHKWNKC